MENLAYGRFEIFSSRVVLINVIFRLENETYSLKLMLCHQPPFDEIQPFERFQPLLQLIVPTLDFKNLDKDSSDSEKYFREQSGCINEFLFKNHLFPVIKSKK